jgi:hypothetical protein
MKKLLFAMSFFATMATSAQTLQPREVGDFTAINCAAGMDVELTQGNENKVAVSAGDDKYLPEIKTEVQNGVLKIYADYKEKLWRKDKNKKLKAFVTYKTIDKLFGGSGAMIKTMNTINAPSLKMDINSGATFNGALKITDLIIDQSSGSVTKISGIATNMKADLSSGTVFNGFELIADNCSVSASSGSVFKITVQKMLNASASSGAAVIYKGEAALNKKDASSGGTVRKM